jgi:hypothetical protein
MLKFKPALSQYRIFMNVYRISESLNSLFSEEEFEGRKVLVPITTTTKNLLPKIKRSFLKRNLYGPSDAITDISFKEYDDANYHYRQYLETRSIDFLDALVATLYRPKRRLLWLLKLLPDYNGQQRIKYNKNKIERRAKDIAKLPLHYKMAIFHFYHSCEKFLHEGEININGNAINLSVLYESDGDAPQPKGSIGLTGLLFEMAETGVFGNAEQTANQNLFDIMSRLYQIKVGANAIREYYKNKTPKA